MPLIKRKLGILDFKINDLEEHLLKYKVDYPKIFDILLNRLRECKNKLGLLEKIYDDERKKIPALYYLQVIDLTLNNLQRILSELDKSNLANFHKYVMSQILNSIKNVLDISNRTIMIYSNDFYAVYPYDISFPHFDFKKEDNIHLIGIPYLDKKRLIDFALVVHEIGHFLYHYDFFDKEFTKPKPKQEEFAKFGLDTSGITIDTKKWMEEIALDVFSLSLVGPAYINSLQHITLRNDPYNFSLNHPSIHIRIDLLINFLEKLGLKNVGIAIKQQWNNHIKFYEETKEHIFIYSVLKDVINEYSNRVYSTIKSKGFPIFDSAKFESAKKVVKLEKSDLKEDFSVILNALWLQCLNSKKNIWS